MQTFFVDTNPDPEKRKDPVELSSVEMHRPWTFHAYVANHNRSATLIYTGDGVIIQRKGGAGIRCKLPLNAKAQGVYWSPDSKSFTFWTTSNESGSRAVAVIDISQIGQEHADKMPPFKILYTSPLGSVPFGIEWSPSGSGIYVIERIRDEEGLMFSRIMYAPARGGDAKEVIRMGGLIDFFMPPVSRFEGGEGPSPKPYWIAFGHPRGLFVVDPDGRQVQQLANLPAIGLQNIEWSPKRDEMALYFRRAIRNSKGESFKGVYVVRMDRVGKKDSGLPAVEQLTDSVQVHTLWYSPRGTYIIWATPQAVFYRKADDPQANPTVITPTREGLSLEVKGVSWHSNERKLAYTAGNHLFIHDVTQPDKDYSAGSFGSAGGTFTAEPVWDGDRVLLSAFHDIGAEYVSPMVMPPLTKEAKEKEEKDKAAAQSKSNDEKKEE